MSRLSLLEHGSRPTAAAAGLYTRAMSSPAPAVSAAPPAAPRTATPTPGRNVRSLSGLLPFLRPYRARIALAVVFLVLAAVSTLVFPVALDRRAHV